MPTAAEKAQTHFAAFPVGRGESPGLLEWVQDGITFAAYDIYVTDDGNGIGVTVDASDINGPLPTDNPYQFFNPPLGIVTQEEVGGWQVINQTLTYVVTTAQVVDTSDTNATLQRIIYDAVVLRAQQLGWSP